MSKYKKRPYGDYRASLEKVLEGRAETDLKLAQTKPRDLISIHDYPRAKYSVYWEIRVGGSDDEGWRWGVRFYDYATSKVVKDAVDVTDKRGDAVIDAQKWVLANIETYHR